MVVASASIGRLLGRPAGFDWRAFSRQTVALSEPSVYTTRTDEREKAMNTLTDINANLFPIMDEGNTYHDMAAYAYSAATIQLRDDEPKFDLDAIDAYEAAAEAHDKRVEALTAKFVNVAMRKRFDTVHDLVVAWWEVAAE